ncbi:hypothetical protein B0H14DRAFT_3527147 [Mycena olivaceomarginata]|nr:hypothetical protein B0H14DRAFT_3527147 [Mycena olivaceomarginata]
MRTRPILRHVCAAFHHGACVVSFLHDSAVNDASFQDHTISFPTKTLPGTLRTLCTIPAFVVIVRGRAPHNSVHRRSLHDDLIDTPPHHASSPCVSCFSAPASSPSASRLRVCLPPRFGSGSDANTLAARRRTHSAGACRIPYMRDQ